MEQPGGASYGRRAVHLCTVFSSNYLANARVMARSFRRHHPEACIVALITDDASAVLRAEEPFEVIGIGDVGLPRAVYDDLRARYDRLELGAALKPWVMLHGLSALPPGATLAYADPDLRFYAPLQPSLDVLGGEIVLTPHLLDGLLPDDGHHPTTDDVFVSGIYNAGFLAVRAGGSAEAMLRWWRARLRTAALVDPPRGLHGDQRWLDWVPGLFDGVRAWRDPGCNVAFWNLHGRRLTSRYGTPLIDGRRLRFFHFSGFEPARPGRLSRHQDRISVKPGSTLARLLAGYAGELEAAGAGTIRALPWKAGRLPSGVAMDPFLRALYRRAIEQGALTMAPFTAAGEAAFLDWCNGRSAQLPRLTRYGHELWLQRPDVQAAFPEVARGDATAFLTWCRDHGREQLPIAAPLLAAMLGAGPAPEPRTTVVAAVPPPARPVPAPARRRPTTPAAPQPLIASLAD